MAFLIIPVVSRQRNRQFGASLIEFAVGASVIGILLTILLQRVWFYQGEAERTAVQQTIANVRAALDIKMAQSKLPGRSINLTLLAEQNPFDLLVDKPVNYLGEFFAPVERDFEAGNWYFDRRDKILVYLLNNANSFESAPTKHLKFKVKLLRLPNSPAKPLEPSAKDGISIEQVNG
jgi:general secretion pathway protein G